MKKVSILSMAVLATVFGLLVLCPESKAQADLSKKYVKDNSRGIVILRPKGLPKYGQYYRNDTLFLHAGKDLIKEYRGNVYLNDSFAGNAYDSDTVILNKAGLFKKARLEFRRVEYQKILGNTGVIYFFPKYPPIEMQNGAIMRYRSGKNEICEMENKIYLNGVFQCEAFANDTIILRPRGILTVKNANKKNRESLPALLQGVFRENCLKW